jgi:hypothetical protein
MSAEKQKLRDEAAVVTFLRDAIEEARYQIANADFTELEKYDGVLPTDAKTKRVLDKVQFLVACDCGQRRTALLDLKRRPVVNRKFVRVKKRLVAGILAVAASVIVLTSVVHDIQVRRHSTYFAGQFQQAEQHQDLVRMERALSGYCQLTPDDKPARERLLSLRSTNVYARTYVQLTAPEPSSTILFLVGGLLTIVGYCMRARRKGRG